MALKLFCSIKSSWAALPKSWQSSQCFEHELNLESGSILRNTGIAGRYIADPWSASDLAALALRGALRSLSEEELKNCLYLFGASSSPDTLTPAFAHFVHKKSNLLLDSINCMDIVSSCTSFLNAVIAAGSVVTLENNERALAAVVASESKVKMLKQAPAKTRTLFGDAACALILKKSKDSEFIMSTYVRSDSDLVEKICNPIGGSASPLSEKNFNQSVLTLVDSKFLFLHTVKRFCHAIESTWQTRADTLRQFGFDAQSFPGLIYVHQANINILKEVKKRLPVQLSQRIPVLMEDIGNVVSVSLPLLRTRLKIFEFCYLSCTLKGLISPQPNEIRSAIRNLTRHCDLINIDDYYDLRDTLCVNDSNETWGVSSGVKSESNLACNWVDRVSDVTLNSFVKLFESQKMLASKVKLGVFADAWVAAGGGFQTVGLLHVKLE